MMFWGVLILGANHSIPDRPGRWQFHNFTLGWSVRWVDWGINRYHGKPQELWVVWEDGWPARVFYSPCQTVALFTETVKDWGEWGERVGDLPAGWTAPRY